MKQRPILLGIVGDSAAGKTTIMRGLTQLLGPERVSHVCTDDYHKYDRQERARLNITPLIPTAIIRHPRTALGACTLRAIHAQAGVRPQHGVAGAA